VSTREQAMTDFKAAWGILRRRGVWFEMKEAAD